MRPSSHQPLVGLLGARGAGVLGQQHDEVALPGAIERAADDRRVHRVSQRRHQQSERAGRRQLEAAGDRVGPVAQPRRRLLDAQPRLGPDGRRGARR